MAQKSITSFFTRINPKEENHANGGDKVSGSSKNPKKILTSKRSHSNEGESSSKKNAPKRQKKTLSPNKETNRKSLLFPESAKKIASSSDEEEIFKASPEKKMKRKAVVISDSSEDESPKVEHSEEIDKKNMKSEEEKPERTDDEKISSAKKKKVDESHGESEIPEKKLMSFFNSNALKKNASETKSFNPANGKYHPIDSACWTRGEKVPYLALARTLEEIENVSARLKMIEILSNYFRSVIVLSPEDLLPSVYLCLNKLAPAYEGIELGVAETSLMKAIAQSTGRTLGQIRTDAQEAGDLGIVAEQSKSNQRMIFQPAALNVRGVFAKLKEIAKMTGNAAQAKKVEKIQSMFVACKHSEARFLIRSLAGKLRIGLAEQSAIQALALACALTPPTEEYPPPVLNASKKMSSENFKAHQDELTLILKTTFCECPNYDLIIPTLLKHGIKELPKHCKLTPGVPLKPMLAHPTKGVQEVLQRFDGLKFTCEWKYDGERAQIHISDSGEVTIYSRNQENNTSKYPDIISRLHHCRTEKVKSCILDCEAVAWDKETKQILPFQILSTRKRKDANEADIKVQVCVFMFDLLYLNGDSMVREPFSHRRSLLKEHFREHEGEWQFATAMDTKTMEEVQEFLEESVKGNCEGLMVKTLDADATYEIAKRSRNWLKLKKDYLDGVGDTLDVVVIGGYLGKGKRTGTYGGFLLACYDTENEEYQSICKIGTGFSDEHLQQHTKFLKEHKIDAPKSYYRYDSAHEPDHWFDAVQVWEIKCADLSLSPTHRAALGIVDTEKGISLRFPRFVRIRDDKTVVEATSAEQVADMYSNQDQIKNQNAVGKSAEEEFY